MMVLMVEDVTVSCSGVEVTTLVLKTTPGCVGSMALVSRLRSLAASGEEAVVVDDDDVVSVDAEVDGRGAFAVTVSTSPLAPGMMKFGEILIPCVPGEQLQPGPTGYGEPKGRIPAGMLLYRPMMV